MLRTSAIKIINEIEIVGGCNVQFALNPNSFEYAIIEINPRVSRSSALASKATGYPIAKVAAKLSLGYTLDEIRNDVTGKTYACHEPAIDYIVVKIPKWPFDKFNKSVRKLGTKMMATGEVMAISNNFESAFLKGIRSLEIGQENLDFPKAKTKSIEDLKERIQKPDDERIFYLAEMLRRGYIKTKLAKLTGIDIFFIEKIEWIVRQEELIKTIEIKDLTEINLRNWKKKGFSDKSIANFMNISILDIENKRKEFNINPTYKMVDTCAGEFEAVSPYYYSTYDYYDESNISNRDKIIVIGSGPIRIGQGIEFDYCTVHSILALKEKNIETIIINNNPETVSTDFTIADKLYFEPLTFEDVMEVIKIEKPIGVILQFGGQTSIKLAKQLEKNNVKIIGTSAKSIHMAEDREQFDELMDKLEIKKPRGKAIFDIQSACEIANSIEYPVLVRPSYVLGGQGMEICYDEENLIRYLNNAFEKDKENPVLIDKYLNGIEVEVDAIYDGENILIPGIMEHLERAGIHSGDSMTVCPPQNLSDKVVEDICDITFKLSKALQVKGMINIQFIVYENNVYVIEVNPRSSRTVPYISKLTGIPIVEIATRVSLGEKLINIGYGIGLNKNIKLVAVKIPVFSTEKIDGVEISLGPEMRSTGEVLGIGSTYDEAMYKGLLALNKDYNIENKKHLKALVTLKDSDKKEFLPIVRKMKQLGYEILSTEGTNAYFLANGIETNKIKKEEIEYKLKNREINFLINTPTKINNSQRDGFKMRRMAIEHGVEVFTSIDTFRVLLEIQEKSIISSEINIYDISNI